MSSLLASSVLYIANTADKTTTFPKYRPAVFIYNVAASEYNTFEQFLITNTILPSKFTFTYLAYVKSKMCIGINSRNIWCQE